MRVSCRHWSVKIGVVFFIQERRTKMEKRDKKIPYEVVIQEIDAFLKKAEGYPVDVDLETQGFYRCNDAGTLPGECADFIFHKCND